MKQSVGVALQLNTQKRIEQKLDALLVHLLGEKEGQKIIDELVQPINPNRPNVRSRDAIGALPLERQEAIRAKQEARTVVEPDAVEMAETPEVQGAKVEARKTTASDTHAQAEAMKAGRKGR